MINKQQADKARVELIHEMKRYALLNDELTTFENEINFVTIVWMRERIMFVRAWASVRGYSDLIQKIDKFKQKLNNEKI